MNKVANRHTSRPLLSDLAVLLDGVPAFAALRPLFDGRAIRVEDEIYGDMYEIRAELPGVDPEEDILVTVRDGRLTITAERVRTAEISGRSEFNYGSFTRTVALPDGADQDEVNATYDRGILTVSVPLSDEHRAAKHIEVIEIIALDVDGDDGDDGEVEDADSDEAADQLTSADPG